MIDHDLSTAFAIEPERYELLDDAEIPFEIDRRAFLKVLGGGLVILCLPRSSSAAPLQRGRGPAMPRELAAWLHVAQDGTITAHTGKAEVGQNIRTSLGQAVADELRVPLESVRLVMADTARTPFDMGTFGSRSTPTMSPQLRRAAAAARAQLIDLAASRWKVDRDTLDVADGKVVEREHGHGRSIGFGELTEGKELLKAIGDGEATTPPSQWKVAGKSAPKVDGRAFVTGKHQYTSDLKRPGMLHGRVLRPPAYGATIASLDASKAEALPGVTVVRDGEFVGVVAPDDATAAKALAALRVEWKPGPAMPSDRELFDHLKQHAQGGPSGREAGSVEEALKAADVSRRATYTVAYIAHTPLEPRAALAEWDGEKMTVWTGSQRPFGVRSEVARALGLGEDKVRAIVPDTGAGYGGKHTGDAAVEAARLSKKVGKPVRVAWTREEEFTWAYFRPAGVIEAAAGASKDGTLVAWDFVNINSGGSGLETPYDVPNRRHAFRNSQSPLRQGSYRALAATANHFARESLMDELATELGLDPLAFRLKNLKDERMKAVLKAAAERFGWGKTKLAEGRGVGLACGAEKGGHVATCAEVEVDKATGAVRVARLVTAFECGAIVNPDHLSNQVEGATVMGLGGALFEAIRFEGGKVLNARLSRYRVPRFADVPPIEVVLLDRKDLPPAGAGETPIVAVAPAVGNAIARASGKRLRAMPMNLGE
ncbi:MAG TPA: molybdopterin cofactor-binding domain-containing protein [Isosphaeraceae bacterium]|jgi:isoquinoline 1-oxidoreductase|nr:molybdopterin cofactor-binding domain-containing protein [Isosphaeraceae bacterium]